MKLVVFNLKADPDVQLRRGVVLPMSPTDPTPAHVAEVAPNFYALSNPELAEVEKAVTQTDSCPVYSLDEVQLHPPIPRPGKIICIGLNYRDHCIETGQAIPDRPVVFAKFNNALTGQEQPIRLGKSERVDYEAELVFVIGKKAYDVPENEALDYVAGYTIANDVSARDWQFADSQWVRGKTPDTYCPLGPWLVTTDELPDPHKLAISCRVNGETLQNSNTEQLVFRVDALISYLSQSMTLEPGDIVLTGTPPGVGFARKPPIYLQPGDRVEVEIEGIGILHNPVVA
jgi:acylpyruvate hydrolase